VNNIFQLLSPKTLINNWDILSLLSIKSYFSHATCNPIIMMEYGATTSYGLDAPQLKDGEVSAGTSLVVLPYVGGVVLGADSRVTTGTYIANRTSDKIAQLSKHIFCARSGSAADTQAIADIVKYHLSQLAMQTGREPTVKTAAHLMRRLCYDNKDQLLAGVIVAGWDTVEGGSIYSISLGGSCCKVPFAMGGSGSTYIWGLVDSEFRTDMSADESRALVKKLLAHAMARDGGSGGIIRTVLVSPDGNDRDYTPGNQLPFGPAGW